MEIGKVSFNENKLWHNHTTGYYSATKKNKLLILIIVSIKISEHYTERSLTQKKTIVWYHLYEVLDEANLSLIQKNQNVWLALGGWGRDHLGRGIEKCFRVMAVFLILIVVWVTQYRYLFAKTQPNYTYNLIVCKFYFRTKINC